MISILLLTLHVTDDIVRWISNDQPLNIALAVLVVLLYGTLVLAERRSGYGIMLLVGLFAAGLPVLHIEGAHYGEIANAPGGLVLVWPPFRTAAARCFPFLLLAPRRYASGTAPR